MTASFSATSSGGERVRHALQATVTYARLAAEYIQEYAHTMGTGQWVMASTLAEATLRTAQTAAGSDSMSPWTVADAQERTLQTRTSAEMALRYIQTWVPSSGQRQWSRAAAIASATVAMAVEAEEQIEEAVGTASDGE
jgi:hypothetical protein